MRIMTQKKRINLFIDSELADSARAYGLNLSTFLTSCLKIWRKNPAFLLHAESEKHQMDRSGFEPEASCLQSRRSTADLPALNFSEVNRLGLLHLLFLLSKD